MLGKLIPIILLVIVLLVIATNIVVVPQAAQFVVERLGVYFTTWNAGIHVKVPFIDRITKKVSLKEQVGDFAPQPVITSAIENLTATTLRNIIGDLELDHTLTSRDVINTKITTLLDEATDKWGIKVNRVELKNIIPPREIQDAMEKQMKAERERRESILRAEGEKTSQILVAEGEKESAILRADAAKEAKIKEAEGEAEAILKIYQAQAEGIRLINESNPTKEYLTLQGHDALAKVANGQSTKIIIPSELQNIAGLVAGVKEIAKE